MSASEKLVVFVDYQNTYKGAREAFFDDAVDHYTCGQFNPLKMGELLVDRANRGRKDGGTWALHQVRMYCGLPDSAKDAKGNGARLRQIQAWGRLPGVQVLYRPLRYPPTVPSLPPPPPQEKGVDVQLAVDVIRMALQDEYRMGIIFSRDTDLRPVVESMLDLHPRIHVACTVAAWQPDAGRRHCLQVPNRRVWCHYLTSKEFAQIADPTDYGIEPLAYVPPSWA